MQRPSCFIQAAAVLAIAMVPAGPSFGQGSDTSSGLARDRGSPGRSETKPSIVHAGAGTTSATTTGYSGTSGASAVPSGKIEVPPPPSADACKAFKETPSYQNCLDVVLRKSRSGK